MAAAQLCRSAHQEAADSLKKLLSSLCLRTVNPLAWMTIIQLPSIVMKVFERLLKNHICSSIPVTLDPLQFAYWPNRSTDDAISQVLHFSLTHIDSKNGNYVRLLFIDYSSAFNKKVTIKLAVKLTDLGLNSSLCDRVKISSPADLKWWKWANSPPTPSPWT